MPTRGRRRRGSIARPADDQLDSRRTEMRQRQLEDACDNEAEAEAGHGVGQRVEQSARRIQRPAAGAWRGGALLHSRCAEIRIPGRSTPRWPPSRVSARSLHIVVWPREMKWFSRSYVGATRSNMSDTNASLSSPRSLNPSRGACASNDDPTIASTAFGVRVLPN